MPFFQCGKCGVCVHLSSFPTPPILNKNQICFDCFKKSSEEYDIINLPISYLEDIGKYFGIKTIANIKFPINYKNIVIRITEKNIHLSGPKLEIDSITALFSKHGCG